MQTMREEASTVAAGAARPLRPDLVQCERCGRCCFVKLFIGDEIVATPFPCPHLDEQTRLCTVYEQRLELNPFCTTVAEGVRLRIFPAGCAYTRGLPGYQAPRMATAGEIVAYAEVCVASLEDIRRIALERLAAQGERL